MAGENDLIGANPPALAKFPTSLPGLRGAHLVPDAGHWIQQERPLEVNEHLLAFLASLRAPVEVSISIVHAFFLAFGAMMARTQLLNVE